MRALMSSRAASVAVVGRKTSLNAWPEGSRRLACLRCDGKFTSMHKGNRMCPPCLGGRHRSRVSEDDDEALQPE
jgi:hypothetical protein